MWLRLVVKVGQVEAQRGDDKSRLNSHEDDIMVGSEEAVRQ